MPAKSSRDAPVYACLRANETYSPQTGNSHLGCTEQVQLIFQPAHIACDGASVQPGYVGRHIPAIYTLVKITRTIFTASRSEPACKLHSTLDYH